MYFVCVCAVGDGKQIFLWADNWFWKMGDRETGRAPGVVSGDWLLMVVVRCSVSQLMDETQRLQRLVLIMTKEAPIKICLKIHFFFFFLQYNFKGEEKKNSTKFKKDCLPPPRKDLCCPPPSTQDAQLGHDLRNLILTKRPCSSAAAEGLL